MIQVNAGGTETARIRFAVENPKPWDAENPSLYRIKVLVRDLGIFRTHLEKNPDPSMDEGSVLFGIRTITADARRGLRIN